MTGRHFLMLTASSLLAGCATLGSTVKGSFDCRAPDGSCAPTRVIDAIMADDKAIADAPARFRSAGNGVPRPERTGERTVTIHFPAYVDARGVLHEEAVAHAVVEGSDWATSPDPTARFSRSPAPSSLREAVVGASAPATEGLEPLPAQAPHPKSVVTSADVPDKAALDAARAGHRIGAKAGAGLEAPALVGVPRAVPAAPPTKFRSVLGSGRPLPNDRAGRPKGEEPELGEFLTVRPVSGEPQ